MGIDSNLVSGLVGAIVGAVVGGLASLAGSVLVNRWRVQQEARLRMYDELVPKIRDEVWLQNENLHDPDRFYESLDAAVNTLHYQLERLRRAGVVAGRREGRLAREIVEAGVAFSPARMKLMMQSNDEATQKQYSDAKEQITQKLNTLQKFLEQRLG